MYASSCASLPKGKGNAKPCAGWVVGSSGEGVRARRLDVDKALKIDRYLFCFGASAARLRGITETWIMNDIYEQILVHLERAVGLLAGRVPEPKLKDFGNIRAFRHVEKTIHQAIVQKLARMVSTLDAARLLLDHGFVQEQASLQRMLDEIQEDILFLVFDIINGGNISSLHSEYLDNFFEEEFDAETAIKSSQKRSMVPRRKIRSYLARNGFAPFDPSSSIELLRTISKTYSGYVHAASPQIMDMYGGKPRRFHMRGMKGNPVYEGHREDLWNYFYRGMSACAMSAKAFGDEELFDDFHRLVRQFENISGKSFENV